MRTRGEATGPVPAASAATTRNLRPRQASGVRSSPAGVTIPRAGGRVTRSSAALTQSDSANAVAVPQAITLTPQLRKRFRFSGDSAAQRATKRPRHSHRSRGFYDEDSDSGDELDNPYITPGSDVEQEANTRRLRATKSATPKKSADPVRVTKSPRRLATVKHPSPKDAQVVTEIEVIPDWASLPYHVLVQIFRYAASPLAELQQARWLVAASGVCRAFAEPALTALYETPPLFSRSMAHGLVSLLSKDPSTTLFNYRPKVKELWIDVDEIASKTYKGQPLDLRNLIGNLPQLKSVQFSHHKDLPPYRSLDGSLRWHYPVSFFEALSGNRNAAEGANIADQTQLHGWQWNRRLMGPDLNLAGLKALHQTPPFQGLKKVSFVNYQVPSLHAKASADEAELAARDLDFIQGLASAITVLPALEHLSIESSTAANDQLLPLLPKTLKTLELVNCWDVNGEDFADYLLASGRYLKNLILRHNQSLSASFLTVLGTACPNLQVLSIDFKTYNHHEFYHDSDPSYDQLLTADQIPDWPSNLETLQLLNMKKWTAEAAETLLQSLVDNAPKLLRLRRLDLKAMLSIPIQERSRLRNKWDRKLRHVFLRAKEDPQPLFSLRNPSHKALNGAVKNTSNQSRKTARGTLPAGSPSRRSGRIAVKSSNSSSRASSVGRDLRSLGRPSYAEPDTDEDEIDDEEEEQEKGEEAVRSSDESQPASPTALAAPPKETPFRHGMCEKVEIQLDNQKSAETTLTMDDFLDSENEDLSDDDWVGDDEDFDSGYAW
ncbi:hypothetical protein N657DRAFT_578837 [Parathielavia appendiculata]|uniref:F-box domain-containing protein n=1 Tax=Parathielavia appendiculata TaxID=2587402 RepID=A0AAN6TUN0_9PEZI|nr:hypothetical protein N657DRAFT_578837 [Parathielavia appendiculata]